MIEVKVNGGVMTLPDFILLANRHLEKEKGPGKEGKDRVREFVVPVDFLRMTANGSAADDVSEVILGYRAR